MIHLTSRPFVPKLRCTLERETAIQRMKWMDDGWLRLENGGYLAQEFVEESSLPEVPMPALCKFVDLKSRPGWARFRGQKSICSLNKQAFRQENLPALNYDNINFIYLYNYFSDTLSHSAISVLQIENGEKKIFQKQEPMLRIIRASG